MQTTLRLDDELYREAKAAAALEGVSMTHFLEDALRQRLGKKAAVPDLPVFDSGQRLCASEDLVAAIREADAETDRRTGGKL